MKKALVKGVVNLLTKNGLFNIIVTIYFLNILWKKYKKHLKDKGERSHWDSHVDMSYIQTCVMSTEHLELGRVEKRTLATHKLVDLFPNAEMRQRVLEAAGRCSEEQPMLTQFLEHEHKWHILNTCTNSVSQLFAPYHVFFNEARRHPSYYQSSWYCFTLTCQRTAGSGRFFITPYKPVTEKDDVGVLRIRIVMMNECELRQVACGEIEPPSAFFNARHEGRYKVIQRFSDMFLRQLETVTGQRQVANWGPNFCGRLSKKKFTHQQVSDEKANGTEMANGDDVEDDSQNWDPEINCFLRIHVPFPCGQKSIGQSPIDKCHDVVLYE